MADPFWTKFATPLAERIYDLIGQTGPGGAPADAGQFILEETIAGVNGDGTYVVGGDTLKTKGLAKLRVGQRVHVLWKLGRRFLILTHTWQRTQGGVSISIGQVLEELHVRATGPGGAAEIWFRSATAWGRLVASAAIPLPAGDEIRNATWGLADNMFFLTVGPASSSSTRRFLVFALARGLGEISTGLPAASFVRQVDEPSTLVLDPITGATFPTFDSALHARLDAQLGLGTTPATAPFLWTVRWQDAAVSAGDTTTVVTHAAIVEDVSGAAAVVWTEALTAASVSVTTTGSPPTAPPWTDSTGTTTVTDTFPDVRIVQWDRRTAGAPRRWAWARQRLSTRVDAAASSYSFFANIYSGIVVAETTTALGRLVVQDLTAGVLYEKELPSSASWNVASAGPWGDLHTTSIPATGENYVDLNRQLFTTRAHAAVTLPGVSDGAVQSEMSPQGWQVDVVTTTYTLVSAGPPAVLEPHPVTVTTRDTTARPLTRGLLLLEPVRAADTTQTLDPASGARTPPRQPAIDDVTPMTHAAGVYTPPSITPPPWAVVGLSALLPRLGLEAALAPTAAQLEASALQPISAADWAGFSDVHVVYDEATIREIDAT